MLLAIDPGGSSGLAFRLDDEPKSAACITIPGYDIKEVVTMIAQRATQLEVIIIESFLGIQYRGSHGIETLEMIGAVRGVCALLNLPVVKQTPAQRKMQEPKALKILQLRKQLIKLNYTPHEVSALAHLLTYERRLGLAYEKQAVQRIKQADRSNISSSVVVAVETVD